MGDDEPKRIQRRRIKGWKMPPNTVYVGRPTKWGNPFEIVEEYDRWRPGGGFAVYRGAIMERGYYPYRKQAAEAAVEEFKDWFDPTDEKLSPIVGKNLACWCPLNQPCHADILLKLANSPTYSQRPPEVVPA